MPTIRLAGSLLASANTVDRLEPIAAELGAGESSPIDPAARNALGLDGLVLDARIANAAGAIRVLLARVTDAPIRQTLATMAARLSSSAPHILWLVVATQQTPDAVAIAGWSSDRRPPRTRALVAARSAIVDSDAETLRALAAAAGPHDFLTHSRWVEILGRDSLTARFYRRLESAVADIAASSNVGSAGVRREIALLHTSRLLFLCFLEAKGWLDGDRSFLMHQYDACVERGGAFERGVLRPLFFGTLNTPAGRRSPRAQRFGRVPFLNGGLFTRTPVERMATGLVFSDDAYGALIYDLFGQYRFTATEESASWSEAAVDPEMLGRAFESLMASEERRDAGAFFTPFALVEQVAARALEDALPDDPARLEQFTVLDPACGSGAFLVHVLERMAARVAGSGDARSRETIRRDVLTRSIFGVDVNPTAVWLCQLRLWLSVVIESEEDDPRRVLPLPNLDRNIRVGDALAGADFDPPRGNSGRDVVRRLRERYTRATGARKSSLARQLDRAERACALAAVDSELQVTTLRRRELLGVRRGHDLFGERYTASLDERQTSHELRRKATVLRNARRRILAGGALPFSFGAHFADVAARAGFSLVIGNPPWVRLHRIPSERRAAFRRDFTVARLAAWDAGAGVAGATRGFAGQVDLAALFIERAIRLTAPAGTIALLVPAKLWRSLSGGGVRGFLATETTLRRVEDFSESAALFDAAVYPSLVVAARRTAPDTACADVVVHRRGRESFQWRMPLTSVAFDDSPGAPWLLLPPDARAAFSLLREAGQPLAASPLGRPLLGVKCGCNDAFVVHMRQRDVAECVVRASDGRTIAVDANVVRPLLRGERLRRWHIEPTDEAILWTHDALDAPLATLSPALARWFRPWRSTLVRRADARRTARWWSLFRIEGARTDLPRVVWGDVGREPRAAVLPAGDAHVPLNTCYVARCRTLADADALAVLLNSALARAWLDALAEPARGGYRRYLGWTTSLLPIPTDWPRARALLAPIGAAARDGIRSPSEATLLEAALAAFGVSHDDVAPLVAWMA